jgi:hypothetical protein
MAAAISVIRSAGAFHTISWSRAVLAESAADFTIESAADFTIKLSGIQNVPFWGDSSCKPDHRITVHRRLGGVKYLSPRDGW